MPPLGISQQKGAKMENTSYEKWNNCRGNIYIKHCVEKEKKCLREAQILGKIKYDERKRFESKIIQSGCASNYYFCVLACCY